MTKPLISVFLLCVLSCYIRPVTAIDINHAQLREGSELDRYAIRLIRFLLYQQSETANFIPYKQQTNSQERRLLLLKQGKTSIDWFGTNQQIENQATALPYPIFRGLLGYRIFIINKDTRHLISKITNIDELRKLTFVQGKGWADTNVLKNAKLRVKELIDYDNIFTLIDANRADLFPRAIFEPYAELQQRKEFENLIVEEHLLLHYKLPMFFFISPTKGNERLKELLISGFEKSYKNGSFVAFFNNDPFIKNALSKVNMSKRNIISIPNPYLSESTLNISDDYWFSMPSLK